MEQPLEAFGAATNQANVDPLATIAQWMEENANKSQQHVMVAAKSVRKVSRDKISTNRLGGHYSTGRPLPMEIREKIVDLSRSGLKPCQISKELRVSHGCVSKLLAKWRKTGTVKPEKIGGSRPKKVLPSVAKAITVYKHYKPRLQSWQIKEFLIKDGVCNDGNVPSISSINKTLRNQKKAKHTSSTSVASKIGKKSRVEDTCGSDDLKMSASHHHSSRHTACQSSTKAELVHKLEAKAAMAALDLGGTGWPAVQAMHYDHMAAQHHQDSTPSTFYSVLQPTGATATALYTQPLQPLQPDQQFSMRPEHVVFAFDNAYQHQQDMQQYVLGPPYNSSSHHQQAADGYVDVPMDVCHLTGFLDDVFV